MMACHVRFGLIVCSVVAASNALAGVVVPNSLEFVEGSGNNRYPFYNNTTIRYQQVYNADQFSAFGGAGSIYALRFRPDGTSGTAFSQSTTVDVRLSTTAAAADGLSTTFSNNVGSDETQVFNGSVVLSSAFTGSGPKDFDIVLSLTTPFVYNPSAGNLLLDVRMTETTTSYHYFDYHSTAGDSISRLYATDVNAVVGGASSGGLVTMFDANPVPEPASLLAIGLGLGILVRARRR